MQFDPKALDKAGNALSEALDAGIPGHLDIAEAVIEAYLSALPSPAEAEAVGEVITEGVFWSRSVTEKWLPTGTKLYTHPAPKAPDLANIGLQQAIAFVRKRCDDYVSEHGMYDPHTGATEFPGNGDETVCEWEEIIEGLEALKTAVVPKTLVTSEFGADEFRHVAELLRRHNTSDGDLRAVLSNNHNVILAALNVVAEALAHSVPAGWRLVPDEPCVEMIGAWYRYKNGHHFHDEPAPSDTSDFGAYRAMLAAAPLPSAPKGGA